MADEIETAGVNKIKKQGKPFTVEETERLIALWATEEVLYNCKNAKYFNKDSRAAALKRVLEKLEKEGLTMAELQKKMACLRTYYGKEFGKEKASAVSGTGGNSLYTSKWPFFTTLHFLRDNITPRKTTSTASSIEIVDEDVQEESGVISVESQVENTPDVKCVFNTTNPPTSLKSKRKLKMSLEDELLTTCLEELKRPKTEISSNPDSSFGQYVVSQLQNIPNGYDKEMLKIEIQQSILKVLLPTPTARQPFSTINLNELHQFN